MKELGFPSVELEGVLDNAPLPPYQFPAGIPVVRHYDEEVLLVRKSHRFDDVTTLGTGLVAKPPSQSFDIERIERHSS